MRKLFVISTLLIVLPLWGDINDKGLDWNKLELQLVDRYGKRAGLRLRAWEKVLKDPGLSTELDKLERVNRFFNLINFSNYFF